MVFTLSNTSSQLHKTECVSCRQNAHLAELPARDLISISENWRLAHAWSALPGWLVVISTRHIVGLAELSAGEAAELGLLLRRASSALQTVIGCKRTYIVLFCEQSGFEHLHVHVVPRMANFDQRHLGSGVFDFLKRPETEWVSANTRDQLALELAEALHGNQS
jgi:diadenosine tetraphosphate (Ap4A) HIT family hydrolase